jgi:hypothetical protein
VPVRLNAYRQQKVIGCTLLQEKQLLPVPVPTRLATAGHRSPPLAWPGRERAHISLLAAGLIGDVGDPVPIRGQLTLAFQRIRGEKLERLAVRFVWIRKIPDSSAQVTAILNPTAGVGGEFTLFS